MIDTWIEICLPYVKVGKTGGYVLLTVHISVPRAKFGRRVRLYAKPL